ncbi:MAG: esterase [Anaerolineaceae bacterium]|nr:esterase [Anaerolineaceae bacterium]
MSRWLMSVFVILLLVVPVAAQDNLHTRVLQHDGQERTYLAYAPDTLPDGPVPVLIGLHGGGGHAQQFMTSTGFNAIADARGFIAVYPDGIDRTWNDGRDGPDPNVQARLLIDDVGFIEAVLDDVASHYSIDPDRVYATGISNGGHMAFRLACDVSERIAGIAPVVALVPANITCEPPNPVSVLLMNGTDDPLVPWQGGTLLRDRGEDLSTWESMALWAGINRCSEEIEAETLPNTVLRDLTLTQVHTYQNCDVPTVLYEVGNGGHTWPGDEHSLPRFIVGRTSLDFDASEVIADFFEL